MFAFWVGTTRMTDYWHNTSDVIAGAIIGTVFASYSFWSYYLKGAVRGKAAVGASEEDDHVRESDEVKVPLAQDTARG